MVEPTGHCPYLGLKQNRAIRFASPTPEHRCYVSGEPLEIPVDQSAYCLSQGHVHCPLYMGLGLPTTSDTAPTPVGGVANVPPGGVRGWYATLSPHDRAIYAIMLGMLAVIVAIYLFAGVRTFFGGNGGGGVSDRPPSSPAATSQPVVAAATAAATAAPQSPTALPTSTPAPLPTDLPATQVLIPPPTNTPTDTPAPPTSTPTDTPAPPTDVSAPTAAPAQPGAPSARPPARPAQPRPAQPRPTTAPANPLPRPTTAPPVVSARTQALTLYFADASGTLYVPVQRSVRVVNNQVAHAAIAALIDGPRGGLQRLVLPDVNLLDVRVAGNTAVVNFDRWPTGAGDDRGFYAITLTLTHLPNVHQVQFQVNGQNVGVAGGDGPIVRPTLNSINPDFLPFDTSVTEFLPLYFPLQGSRYDVRLIRMVPKTSQTAEGTVRALLEGPGEYADRVRTVIPDGTELRGIKRTSDGVIIVDFTQPFADAADRQAAVRTIVESLTTLRTVTGVQFLVEGASLADQWGPTYGRIFQRPAINPEV